MALRTKADFRLRKGEGPAPPRGGSRGHPPGRVLVVDRRPPADEAPDAWEGPATTVAPAARAAPTGPAPPIARGAPVADEARVLWRERLTAALRQDTGFLADVPDRTAMAWRLAVLARRLGVPAPAQRPLIDEMLADIVRFVLTQS